MRAGLLIGLLWAQRAPVETPPLENWARCASAPVNTKAIFTVELGTVQLGDAGCEWLTAISDGGALTSTHHRIFGTRRGGPDVRAIAQKVTSMAESLEWHDDDGDGFRQMQRREVFSPEGETQRIEQFDWDDAGTPLTRSVLTQVSPKLRHLLEQRFVDGGWSTTHEADVPHRCVYQPIVPVE